MKAFLLAVTVAMTSSAFAAPSPINPCTVRTIKFLNDSIESAKKDGFVNVKLMKNNSNETLGFYAWNKTEDEMHAEICEDPSTDDSTVASAWYYWDNSEYRSNPAQWTVNSSYQLVQDEGIATLTLRKASPNGDITADIEVAGTDDSVARKDTVRFVKQ